LSLFSAGKKPFVYAVAIFKMISDVENRWMEKHGIFLLVSPLFAEVFFDFKIGRKQNCVVLLFCKIRNEFRPLKIKLNIM
jgi:hypothetical protein